jgi:superfamily II RNA helicase
MFYKQYKLDKFQEEAINSIEKNHSVIVAAPTGAGKTLIAEYALEKHLKSGKQIIYTSPIKALSNQKYRDFSGDYKDQIGIITGDVVINDNAPVLIMTTEILRNIIFDDINRLNEVDYVIFDEIHYIDDQERGTVWEECIIFAPQHVNFICLSATIPNLREFTSWMQSVRHNRIDMVVETHRPVPLEHRLYFRGYGLGWLNELKELQRGAEPVFSKGNKNKGISNIQNYETQVEVQVAELPERGIVELDGTDLIEHIQLNNHLPCLYFSFSRKSCEENALQNLDRNFLTPDESDVILFAYDQLCRRYGVKNDINALQLRKLVEHGVAYHHAGMLPTLKEVVERLFTIGHIKLLFTTETFALGINMPACSVVFGNIAKYDGIQFRFLKAREYHQMAGRAGRRGIDTKGYVYAHVDVEYDDYAEVKHVVSGEIEKIESQFNLSYSSILNLYEKYGERIYDVCERSLGNYQSIKVLREISRSLEKFQSQKQELDELACIHDGDMDKFQEYRNLEKKLKEEHDLINKERRSGRNSKKKKINKVSKKTAKLVSMMRTIKCHKCENLKKCMQIANKTADYDGRIIELSQRRELVEDYHKNQIKNRLDLLTEIGYKDHKGLLPRGKIASQIYGYELQVTELFFDGYFHRLDSDWINVLITAIVFESKRDCWYKMIEKSVINPIISEPIRKIKKIMDIENEYGILPNLKELDTKLSYAAYEWSKGCSFDELKGFTDTPPGDLVRYFRLASDLLRQIKRVVSIEDPLYHKINDCISRINRDVVDAEKQLRAG